MKPETAENNFSLTGLLKIFLIASLPFLYFYFIFIAFQPQIINCQRPSDEYILQNIYPPSGLNNEHDGIEPKVLFLFILLAGPLGYLLYRSSMPQKALLAISAV